MPLARSGMTDVEHNIHELLTQAQEASVDCHGLDCERFCRTTTELQEQILSLPTKRAMAKEGANP